MDPDADVSGSHPICLYTRANVMCQQINQYAERYRNSSPVKFDVNANYSALVSSAKDKNVRWFLSWD